MKKIISLFLIIAITLFAGCNSIETSTTTTTATEVSTIAVSATKKRTEYSTEVKTETQEIITTAETVSTTAAETTIENSTTSSVDNTTESSTNSVSETEYLENIPAYSGNPHYIINNNVPFISDEDKKRTDAFELYSDLDSLGRCGVAYANICKELRPTEERGSIGSVKPSGWQTIKYAGLVDGNYLYNRCHLIAFMLAGENANEKNLITGTRYLNIEGMLYYEEKVDDYLDNNANNHVLYRVTPVFTGNNLVADGVLMEAYSVEDSGSGVCFCVYCYNVQPGVTIDYATGDSHLTEGGNAETTAAQTTYNEEEYQKYILNTNSKKFHSPSCSSVSKISEKNREEYNGPRQWLIDNGYDPCGICKP